jgi:Zn-dependent protease
MTSLAYVASLRLRGSHRARYRTLVLGVPLTMQPSWLFGVALTAWTAADALLPAVVPGRSLLTYTIGGVTLAAALAVSLVLHEAAHCLAARRGGLAVRRLSLGFLGGQAELDTAPRLPRVAAGIAIAGPLANALVGLVAAVAHIVLVELDADPLLAAVAALLAVANLFLTVFNLVPALPLDGGRVLHAAIWALTGREAIGTRVATATGRAVGAALLVVALIASASGDAAVALWLAVLGLSVHGG